MNFQDLFHFVENIFRTPHPDFRAVIKRGSAKTAIVGTAAGGNYQSIGPIENRHFIALVFDKIPGGKRQAIQIFNKGSGEIVGVGGVAADREPLNLF